MKVNVGGTLKPVVSAKVNVGGTLKTVVRAKHNVAGAIKTGDTFTLPLSAIASPGTVNGFSASATVTTNTTTATPTGGLGPYTYSWARITGSGSITAATSATTAFYATLSPESTSSGTFRCTATDSLGSTATIFADVLAEFERF